MLEMIIMAAAAEMTVDIITHVFCHTHQSSHAVQTLWGEWIFLFGVQSGVTQTYPHTCERSTAGKQKDSHHSFFFFFLHRIRLCLLILPRNRQFWSSEKFKTKFYLKKKRPSWLHPTMLQWITICNPAVLMPYFTRLGFSRMRQS